MQIQRKFKRVIELFESYAGALTSLPENLVDRYKSGSVQRDAFERLHYGSRKRLVVFFIPGMQRVTGGVLQIFSLNRLTREHFAGTETDSLICWLPGEGRSFHKFEGFNNEEIVFPIDLILGSCSSQCEFIFHLPEYAAEIFVNRFGWNRLARLSQKHRLMISIMNQNYEAMAAKVGVEFLERLKKTVPELNCSVGHSLWATEQERRHWGIPLHFIPTWYYPDDAPCQSYETKENLLIVSPDKDPHRELVLGAIRNAFPDLRIQVIWGLKYEQYLEYERKAKWSITFGEGLDGYFYGPVLRGGVSFAVRNTTFDLPGLEDLRTVYDSYEAMVAHIAADIKALDAKYSYETYNKILRVPIENEMGPERTSSALRAFYRGEMTCP